MSDARTRLQVLTASDTRAASAVWPVHALFIRPVPPHSFRAEAERLHQYEVHQYEMTAII
jgi:hypothetical protein